MDDPTPDYMNLLGMIFSMCGLMLKVGGVEFPWVSLLQRMRPGGAGSERGESSGGCWRWGWGLWSAGSGAMVTPPTKGKLGLSP